MIKKMLLTALCAVSFGIAKANRAYSSSTVSDSTGQQQPAFYEQIPLVTDLLGYAKKHLTTRYRSGGTSPRGFDCSGFTRYCFRNFGVLLPHSSAAQGHVGTAIKKETAQPGDLIFFKGHSSRGRSIGHVGMIVEIAGDRIKFIHSAWGGGVRYDWLHASYYQRRYMGIRRVLSGV